MDRFHIVQQLN
ncbi:hypothetical protein MMJ02_10670, partial [Enterococcus cecorum]|nr:hypothetical protein [Enterococcus cecorum]